MSKHIIFYRCCLIYIYMSLFYFPCKKLYFLLAQVLGGGSRELKNLPSSWKARARPKPQGQVIQEPPESAEFWGPLVVLLGKRH